MYWFLGPASAVRSRLSPSDLTDELCCVFVRSVLAEIYGAARVDAVPVARWHVQDPAHPWSAIEAVWDAGLADEIRRPEPGRPVPGVPRQRVAICQGWSGLRDDRVVPGAVGHTFAWLALGDDGTGIRIDAAAVATATKPGRAAPGAEARWTTWAELTARYSSGVTLALLRLPARARV